MQFTVTYAVLDGTAGIVVQDVSLYDALRCLTGPFEAVKGGLRETAPRHVHTHRGEPTQRRTLLVPVGMTEASVGRLARYLRVIE
jgi:hypothetical protein